MDKKESDLIRQHRRAAREYSDAVAKLLETVGNHERFAAVQKKLVEPARARCHLIYSRWWELYRQSMSADGGVVHFVTYKRPNVQEAPSRGSRMSS